MKTIRLYLFYSLLLFPSMILRAQSEKGSFSGGGVFSLGSRSTISLFEHDGPGLGTGGQFRIQLNKSVNTDWFADYITINVKDKVRSEYLHIGWSVLYYPFPNQDFPKRFRPYFMAGHCFDYNKKTLVDDASISLDRWGSAVQGGIGTHFQVNERFDVSLNCQYMIHLTKEIESDLQKGAVGLHQHSNKTLEGHLLSTISLNYKLFHLWNRR